MRWNVHHGSYCIQYKRAGAGFPCARIGSSSKRNTSAAAATDSCQIAANETYLCNDCVPRTSSFNLRPRVSNPQPTDFEMFNYPFERF